MSVRRVPRGVPTGGQFAARRHAEADISLTDEPNADWVPRPLGDRGTLVEEPRSRFSDDIEDATDELLDMENTAYENWVAAGSPNPDADGPHRRWATRARQEKALPQIVLDRRQVELRAKVKGSLENPSLSGDISDRAEKIAETMGLDYQSGRRSEPRPSVTDTRSNARKRYDESRRPGPSYYGPHGVFSGPETRAEEIEMEQEDARRAEEARRNPRPAADLPHDGRSNAKKEYDRKTIPAGKRSGFIAPRPAITMGPNGPRFAGAFYGPETRSEELRQEADEAEREGRSAEASQLRRQADTEEVKESAERDRKAEQTADRDRRWAAAAEQRRAQDQPAPAAEAPKRRWFGR